MAQRLRGRRNRSVRRCLGVGECPGEGLVADAVDPALVGGHVRQHHRGDVRLRQPHRARAEADALPIHADRPVGLPTRQLPFPCAIPGRSGPGTEVNFSAEEIGDTGSPSTTARAQRARSGVVDTMPPAIQTQDRLDALTSANRPSIGW